jgi:hypothetical protein
VNNFKAREDLFGRFGLISVRGEAKKFLFKIIGLFESNGYCNVPLVFHESEPVMHDNCVPVVNVVCCGVSEEKVLRVALSDVELMGVAQPPKTNFEKWKDGLTLEKLARSVGIAHCPICPLYSWDRDMCECMSKEIKRMVNTKDINGETRCKEIVMMWGEQEAQDE